MTVWTANEDYEEPMDSLRMDHKRVAVTGAAGGIGRAIASRFANAGAEVILLDLNSASAQEVGAVIASDAASFMTGADYPIDGGFLTLR